MAAKDFRKAMGTLKGGLNRGGEGASVFGDKSEASNPFREELERLSAQVPVTEIFIDSLLDNPFQYLARAELDHEALEELAESIRQNGFYGALLARRKPRTALNAEVYELAYGHRRREAAALAGLKTLPVKVVELTDAAMARIMASENFSREDLTPLGEANVIGLLYTQQNLSAKEIENVVGRKRGWVEHRLALFEAPQEIKLLVEQKPDTLTFVRPLMQISDSKLRQELIGQILEGNLRRDELQSRINAIKQGASDDNVKNVTSSIPDGAGEKVHKPARKSSSDLDKRLATALGKLIKAEAEVESVLGSGGAALNKKQKAELEQLVERLKTFL